jgi:hypothetical protein
MSTSVLGTPSSPQTYSTLEDAITAAASYALVWAQIGTVIYRITGHGNVVVRIN